MLRFAPMLLWIGCSVAGGCGPTAGYETAHPADQPTQSASTTDIKWRNAIPAAQSTANAREASGDQPEFHELRIPLTDGSYRDHDILRECNRVLGTVYDLDSQPNLRRKFTEAHRIALRLGATAGGIEFQERPDSLILRIPNREHPEARRKHREKISELFGFEDDWPKGKGLHLSEDFSPDRPTVLLVHGLFSGQQELKRLEQAFHHSNVQTIVFDYPNTGSIARAGEHLQQELKALADKYPRLRLGVVAHSMGGLVARHCLETWPGGSPPATHLITLGTPHHGTNLTGAHVWVKAYFQFVEQRSLPETIQEGFDEAADDLKPRSYFLRELNERHRPAGLRYFTAAGKRPFLSEDERTALQQRLMALLQRQQAPAETSEAVQAFFQSDELRAGRGDGAVSVESALLDDVDGQKIFDVHHLDLLQLPVDHAHDHEVFQWIQSCLNAA